MVLLISDNVHAMDKHARKILADNIRSLRESRKLSQSKLAKKAGTGQTTVSSMEDPTGKAPGIDNIESIAHALGVETYYLLIPGAPTGAKSGHMIEKTVSSTCSAEPEGIANIERIAETEARYSTLRSRESSEKNEHKTKLLYFMKLSDEDKRKLESIKLKSRQEKSRERAGERRRKAQTKNKQKEHHPLAYFALVAVISITYPMWCAHDARQSEQDDATRTAKDKREKPTAQALLLCQQTIKNYTLIPNKTHVPWRKNNGEKGEYYFSWPRSAGATASNQYGVDIPISAHCIVNAETMLITSLSINGEELK